MASPPGGTGRTATPEPGGAPAADGPSLTVAAVARRLGVAPATLRTWARRYGLGPSEHQAGSHRRYTPADVARLLVMRRLTLEGVAPSEAARTALTGPVPDGVGDAVGSRANAPSTAEVMEAYSGVSAMAPDPSALAAAARSFDNAAVRWMLARVHPRESLAWWAEMVQPARHLLTARTELHGPGENPGAALTAAAFAELRSRAAASAAGLDEQPGPVPTVLVVPVTEHADDSLRVHVLATALQSGGVRVLVLSGGGSDITAKALEHAGPAAVVVDVLSADANGHVAGVVRRALRAVPDAPVFVHCDGNDALELPSAPTVHRVRTLTGALHEVLAVV